METSVKILVTGARGSGRTTVSQAIAGVLKEMGFNVLVAPSRFPRPPFMGVPDNLDGRQILVIDDESE